MWISTWDIIAVRHILSWRTICGHPVSRCGLCSTHDRSPMRNKRSTLYVGSDFDIEWPAGGYLCITDKLPKKLPAPRHPLEVVKVFDPKRDHLNPLQGMDHKKARELADIFYANATEGSDTLTVRNGRRTLSRLFVRKFDTLADIEKTLWAKATDKDISPGELEALGTISDVLLSPVVKRVVCHPTDFSFNVNWVILAKIDPEELGEDDARFLALLLMMHYKGLLVVPEFGLYARNIHTRLIRKDCLIAGVNELKELPEKVRNRFMLVPNKVIKGATWDDAVELVKYHKPHYAKDYMKPLFPT